MNFYKEITERMPGGLIIYEANVGEKIIFANEAAIKIFGCKDFAEFMEYVGGTFKGMVYEEDLSATEESISTQVEANENQNDHVLYRIKRKDGSLRWIDDFGHLEHTENGENLYYVFIYDITEKKQAENEAKLAEQALLCEKHLNEAKNAFIFNISHDFRTPMNAIMGYLQLAKQHVNQPAICLEHLEKVSLASQHLLALIDDLLELSALDARGVQLKPEPVNLAKVVKDTLDMFKPLLDEKELQLSLELEPGDAEVSLDAPRFQRALANIISNACKFTPKQGQIKVSIHRLRESETGFIRFGIKISDTGPGISPDFLPKIFKVFEREETSTKSGHLGTGIGLTITKRIMDIMGGSVEAESKKGQGATFNLSLPLKLLSSKFESTQVVENVPQAAKLEAKGRILLVEDIEINRLMAETILSEFGFDIESVADGCDAVDIVAKKPPHYYSAILMDIQMPIMNGYEATKAIRALGREDLANLPIIALSANAREEDKKRSLESGMNAHVAKPFDVENLIATINRYSTQYQEVFPSQS
ncbi:MAG: response regulator [Desulfovibrionaceae bacterium]|nr:response regulator [Desulfovibrionaceae bacterium]